MNDSRFAVAMIVGMTKAMVGLITGVVTPIWHKLEAVGCGHMSNLKIVRVKTRGHDPNIPSQSFSSPTFVSADTNVTGGVQPSTFRLCSCIASLYSAAVRVAAGI